jgi:hypothetical protein
LTKKRLCYKQSQINRGENFVMNRKKNIVVFGFITSEFLLAAGYTEGQGRRQPLQLGDIFTIVIKALAAFCKRGPASGAGPDTPEIIGLEGGRTA